MLLEYFFFVNSKGSFEQRRFALVKQVESVEILKDHSDGFGEKRKISPLMHIFDKVGIVAVRLRLKSLLE